MRERNAKFLPGRDGFGRSLGRLELQPGGRQQAWVAREVEEQVGGGLRDEAVAVRAAVVHVELVIVHALALRALVGGEQPHVEQRHRLRVHHLPARELERARGVGCWAPTVRASARQPESP